MNDQLETQMLQFLRRALPAFPRSEPHEIRLQDLDLDSLDYVELLCALHEELGIRLQERDLENVETIGDLLTLIHQQRSVSEPQEEASP